MTCRVQAPMALSKESLLPPPGHAAFTFAQGAQAVGVLPMDTSTSSVPTTTSPAASSATIIPGMAAAPAERTIAATPPTTAAPIRTPRNTFAPVPAEVRLFPETLSTDSLVTAPSVSCRVALVNSASDANARGRSASRTRWRREPAFPDFSSVFAVHNR